MVFIVLESGILEHVLAALGTDAHILLAQCADMVTNVGALLI
jgi:hypothetical protein